jgi:hypothetical protein
MVGDRDDLQSIRTRSGFRTLVWAFRFIAFALLCVSLAICLGTLGVRGVALALSVVLAFASVAIGIGLIWASILSLGLLTRRRSTLSELTSDYPYAVRRLALIEAFSFRRPN